MDCLTKSSLFNFMVPFGGLYFRTCRIDFVFVSWVPNIIHRSLSQSSNLTYWKIFFINILYSFFVSHMSNRPVFSTNNTGWSIYTTEFVVTYAKLLADFILVPHTFWKTLYKYISQFIYNNNYCYLDCSTKFHLRSAQELLDPSDRKLWRNVVFCRIDANIKKKLKQTTHVIWL